MKLHVYVLRQLVLAFVIAAGGMLFVALPGIAVGAVHKLAGVGTVAVIKYIPLVVANFIPYVLPVAFLLTLVATYGRLAADNEWTAIRMAGINPYRMLTPALVFGAVLAGGVYFMNAEALPYLRYMERAFRVAALRDVLRNLSPGRTELHFEDFYLAAGYRDPETNTFYDVFMEVPLPEEEGGRRSVLADSTRFEFTDEHLVALLNGVHFVDEEAKGKVSTIEIYVPLDDLVPDPMEDFSSPRYRDSGQLLEALSRPDLKPEWRITYTYAFHRRIANAMTTLMFVFLGVPTGILIRRGTQLSALAVAVGYAFAYWVLSLRFGQQLAESGAVPAWFGAWGPVAAFALVGALLTWRAFRQ